MRICTFGAAIALFALAGVAKADQTWDDIIPVPGAHGAVPGQYLVCPPETKLDNRYGKVTCRKGVWAPESIAAPRLMPLQAALDMHLKLPAGQHAVALGPTQAFGRYGVLEDQFGIAYKIVKN